MVKKFENLKKKTICICKCCVVVSLPANFEKDWPTLLPDCFAWFSHRQTLNWILIVLAHLNNSQMVDMSLHAKRRSRKYQLHSLWFDPTSA